MKGVLLDTDILSHLMKGDVNVSAQAAAYLSEHDRLSFSIITRYEILRGLRAKSAHLQEARFDVLCSKSNVFALTDSIIKEAAGIYAQLRSRGEMIGDADILIAATAIVNEIELNTNNRKHFERVAGLKLTNWLQGNA